MAATTRRVAPAALTTLLAAATTMATSLSCADTAAAGLVPIPTLRGVNIHFTSGRTGEVPYVSRAYDVARMDFSWGAIEQVKGQYDFASYDTLLAQQTDKGNDVLVAPYWILDYGNSLYDGGLSPHHCLAADSTPEGIQAFVDFALASLDHFKGNGVIWEMWNEPNGGFWKPTPNATAYAALAVAVGKAIKGKYPDEIFVGPTTSGIDLGYLTTVFQAGALQYFDGVSVHPYRDSNPETAEKDYAALRALIMQYAPDGRGGMPILSGEWGYTTCSPPSPHCAGAGPVDEVTQAKYLVRRYFTDMYSDVPVSVWYDWVDDGSDQSQREQRFGTVQNGPYDASNVSYPLPPKPSYMAARTFAAQVRQPGCVFSSLVTPSLTAVNTSWVRIMAMQPAAASGAAAGNAGADSDALPAFAYAAWLTQPVDTPAPTTWLVEPASAGSYDVVDYMGNTLASVAVDAQLSVTVPLSDGPVYLKRAA